MIFDNIFTGANPAPLYVDIVPGTKYETREDAEQRRQAKLEQALAYLGTKWCLCQSGRSA